MLIRLRPVLAGALQLLLGAGLLMGVTYGVLQALAMDRLAHLPAGWSIIQAPADVASLARVGDRIWAGGAEGLALFSVGGEAQPLPAELTSLRFVSALRAEPDGSVWIAHEVGVSRWRPGTLENFDIPDGRVPGRVLSLHRDRSGTLWVGHERGLVRWIDGHFESVTPPAGFSLGPVDAIWMDRTGTLWLGDSSPRSAGLVAVGKDGWHRYRLADGLPHQSVNAILEDRQGTLWVGTGFAGQGAALAIEPDGWRIVGRREGLAGDKVRSVYEDSRGRLWFGSEYDGVGVRDAQGVVILDTASGLSGPEVKSVLEYPSDTFWLGTTHGITRIEGYSGMKPNSG
ncbi:ligand-binding sensor domain-containing protein [Thiocystis violacea]|uniref:ligand-binding sensor domain-containing protein n=1 Tax=Thiocystis violacea TaxID=13725 RepID=UPI001906341E|nr:two-component regulator propeller domain-containing protein [Thiocystis violacea]MBK1720281.1 hypothetical protein [Thiocystis violacea]